MLLELPVDVNLPASGDGIDEIHDSPLVDDDPGSGMCVRVVGARSKNREYDRDETRNAS
jgi:hypothetical protein